MNSAKQNAHVTDLECVLEGTVPHSLPRHGCFFVDTQHRSLKHRNNFREYDDRNVCACVDYMIWKVVLHVRVLTERGASC
jgi:hypothetical protein